MGIQPMHEGESAELRLIRQTHGIVEGLEKVVTNLDHAWRGNGGPGLAEKVRTLESKVKDLEKQRSVGDGKLLAQLAGIVLVIGGIIEGLKYIFGG